MLDSKAGPSRWRTLLQLGTVLLFIGATEQYSVSFPRKQLQPGEHCCNIDETKLWSQKLTGLGPEKAAALMPLFNYSFYMPKTQLRAGVTHYGPADRLRYFVTKMLEGSGPVKVGVIGGSISWGEGATQTGVNDWFSIFAEWLRTAAKAGITSRNGCQPATTSAYMELCMRYAVDSDVDLVFVEYVFNDGTVDQLIRNPTLLVVERLVRRLLAMPSRPAVVLLQVPHVNGEEGYDYFHATSEDVEASLSGYYDVPTLSSRVTMWQTALLYPEQGFWWTDLYRDHHPGDGGHRAMADLAVHLIQRAALDVAVRPLTEAEREQRARPLPPPIYPGNLPSNVSNCFVGTDIFQLVRSKAGWKWVNEGTEQKPKRGYVANAPGSSLILLLNTATYPQDPSQNVLVMLSLLVSHRPMGVLRVECMTGCLCTATEFDLWNPGLGSTQTFMFSTEVSQADRCYVWLKVVDRPLPNGTARSDHKVRVSGVVVTDWIRPPASRFETWAWGLGQENAGVHD